MRKYDPVEIILTRAEQTSQAQLARDFGVSRQYLNDVIKGRRPPSQGIIEALGLTQEIVYTRVKK